MRPRRTAIVPKMIWGTAMAATLPRQLLARGGACGLRPLHARSSRT